MSRLCLAGILIVTSAVTGVAADKVREGPVLRPAAEAGVGRMIADLQIRDVNGQPVTWSKMAGKNGLAIALTSTSCPVSKKYGPTLAKLEREFAAQGIPFVFINPTKTDSADDIRKFIAANGLTGPYVHDEKAAKAIGAASTAEVILIDSQRTIVYRGAVDDQYGLGYQTDAPKRTYLRDAVAALVAGRPVYPAATTAPGCVLDVPAATPTTVTYHNRISRIVQTHCLECHRTGGVGPFKLETMEDVIAHAGMIRKVVDQGTMPPWFAQPGSGGDHGKWINDRRMPDADKADLRAWLNGDRAAGNPADAPKPKSFKEGWLLGKPDLVLQLPKPISIPAEGQMPYQNVVVETKLPEDKWVRAVEIAPSDRAAVHHVLVFILNPEEDGQNELGSEERRGFFAAYVPGMSMLSYPDGFAKRLPKGARLRFQIHYTPYGTKTTDQLKLAVAYAEKPPQYEVKVAGMANLLIRIPPGAEKHPEKLAVKLPAEITLLAFLPHMHVRGTAARYEVTEPGKPTEVLLDVPHYDFNWQLDYRLAQPRTIPAGSTITFTGWFDNSTKNPANPDPTRTVRWGPQTSDEMCLGYVEYIVPFGTPANAPGPLAGIGFDREGLYKQIDDNHDGKVTRDEFAEFAKSFPRLKDPLFQKLVFDRLDTNKDGTLSQAEFMNFGRNRQ